MLSGTSRPPRPALVVNFRSFATGCVEATMCTAVVADTALQQGQGMHGSASRAETRNFMAARGPDFKRGFIDRAPVSNADVGRTIARILGLRPKSRGALLGRVAAEAMPGGRMPKVERHRQAAAPGAGGLATVLDYQTAGGERYLDAAGFPGRTVGLR
jgi:hypothetical protein